MLTINLLPWRDKAEARRNKIFNIAVLISFILSAAICYFQYHRLKAELHFRQVCIEALINKSENYVIGANHALGNATKLVKNIRYNQDQFKKILHAIFVHDQFSWGSLDLHKRALKIHGVAPSTAALLAFVEWCEKKYHFSISIKSIKQTSSLDSILFQIQIDNFAAELRNNAMD